MRKKGITPRDRKIVRQRVQGKSIRAIAHIMNMRPATVFVVLKRLEPELKQALEAASYGLDKAVTKMVEMAEAKKTEFFSHEGIVTDSRTVADNATRFAARRELLKVHGVDLAGVKVDASVNQQINVLGEAERQQLIQRAKKLIELERASEAEDAFQGDYPTTESEE